MCDNKASQDSERKPSRLGPLGTAGLCLSLTWFFFTPTITCSVIGVALTTWAPRASELSFAVSALAFGLGLTLLLAAIFADPGKRSWRASRFLWDLQYNLSSCVELGPAKQLIMFSSYAAASALSLSFAFVLAFKLIPFLVSG